MVNYANLVGFAFDDEIGNFYVPGQQTNLPASAVRYGIAVASAPIENFINEFLPDVARRTVSMVLVVGAAFHQPGGFQPVNQPCDGNRLDLQQIGDFLLAEARVAGEAQQQAPLRAGHAHDAGALVRLDADQPGDVVQQ